MPLGAAGIGALAGGVLSTGASMLSNSANKKAAAAQNAPYLNAIAQAQSVANQPFQGYSGQMTAPLSAQESQAASLAGTDAAQSTQFRQQAATPFGAANLKQYMNPYAQDVVNPTLQNLTQNYNQQVGDVTRKQNMTDAFGYGRTAAALSPLNQNYENTYANTEEAGLGKAYGAAVGEFNNQQSAFGKLADEAGDSADNGVGGLLSTGKDIREAGTQADQAQYGEFLRGQNWSRDQIQPLIQTLSATKGSLVNPSYTSPLSAGIGGAVAGFGMGNQLNGGGSNGGIDTNMDTNGVNSSIGAFNSGMSNSGGGLGGLGIP